MTIIDKEKYKHWMSTNQVGIPIFYHPWYLDIVCYKGEWNVVLSMNNEVVEGILVYYQTKKYFHNAIIMPPLTPFLGIWLPEVTSEKEVYKNRKENKIVSDLVQAIPSNIVMYIQSHPTTFKNWLPYYWRGYDQTTRYTFIIPDLSKWSKEDLATNVRNKINKSSQNLVIKIENDVEGLYDQLNHLMIRKGQPLTFSKEMVKRLDEALEQRNSRLIISAIDKEDKIHASAYVIFDQDKAYMMMLSSDVDTRQNGAVPFVIYNAIEIAKNKVKTFDFEGSMLPFLFDLFSGFGGNLTPYFSVLKAKNWVWDIGYRMKRNYDKNFH